LRFLLFVEGKSEHKAIADFLRKWLNAKVGQNIGLQTVNLKGSGAFGRKILGKVSYHLGRDSKGEIVAAVGLLDLYGGADYPETKTSVQERYEWAVKHYEETVDDDRFRMFFAVHETEAWLLAEPGIFPQTVQGRIRKAWSQRPESVNFDHPPSDRLNDVYLSETRRAYRKVTDGTRLLGKLSPETVYERCPHFKCMLDTLLDLAKKALKEN